MRIILLENLENQQKKEIESFIWNHPKANYFQSPAYFEICKNSPNLSPAYICAYKGDKLIGLMLFVRQTLVNLPILRFFSSRNIIWGGPIIEEKNLQLLNELLRFYNKSENKVIYTQIRNLSDTLSCKHIFHKNGFKYEPHLDILVDLSKSLEALWKDVHTKRRNEVRRSSKEGVVFSVRTDKLALLDCYQILTEVYKRAKLPLPKLAHFDTILQSGNLKIFTAQYQESTIGCMLCIAYKDILFDYYAGAFSKFYDKYPNDLIPWEVFKWAKENGYKLFDWGGAGKPNIPYGVRDYKLKFGGELVNYGRYIKPYSVLLYDIITHLFNIYRKVLK